jgi:hypothetical protein
MTQAIISGVVIATIAAVLDIGSFESWKWWVFIIGMNVLVTINRNAI